MAKRHEMLPDEKATIEQQLISEQYPEEDVTYFLSVFAEHVSLTKYGIIASIRFRSWCMVPAFLP